MGRRLRVLLVDDDPEVLSSLSDLLQSLDHVPVPVLGDADVVNAVQAIAFDVAIVDARMPLVDGFQLGEAILQARPGTPLALLTGHSDAETVARGLSRGFTRAIGKPVGLSAMLKVMRALDGALARSGA
jgi:DNA-binding NtrC family response regulator